MTRDDKAKAIGDLRQRLEGASLIVLTDFRGLTAGQLDELRKSVRGASAEYRVAKNTLTRQAVSEAEGKAIAEHLKGPTAIVFSSEDPIVVAKVVVKFADDNEALTIKGGFFEGQALTSQEVKALAELPSREESLSQLLGLLQAPATQLVRLLQEPAAQLARCVDAIRQKQESS